MAIGNSLNPDCTVRACRVSRLLKAILPNGCILSFVESWISCRASLRNALPPDECCIAACQYSVLLSFCTSPLSHCGQGSPCLKNWARRPVALHAGHRSVATATLKLSSKSELSNSSDIQLPKSPLTRIRSVSPIPGPNADFPPPRIKCVLHAVQKSDCPESVCDHSDWWNQSQVVQLNVRPNMA